VFNIYDGSSQNIYALSTQYQSVTNSDSDLEIEEVKEVKEKNTGFHLQSTINNFRSFHLNCANFLMKEEIMVLIDMSKGKIPDYLDDEDYLAILSIGESKLTHTKLQKISYVLSNITKFEGKFTAYDYGNFSESIMEKIQSPLNRNIYSVSNDTYSLTTKGMEIYRGLIELLNPDNRSAILNLLKLLRGMSAVELEVLTYHLFPEMARKSKVGPNIEQLVLKLKLSSKNKAVRDGNTVTLTVE